MSAPPAYTDKVDNRKESLPPYRASHTFSNDAEELAALREFAESKMYINQGSDGTLPSMRAGGVKALAWGGPMLQTPTHFSNLPVLPPAEAHRLNKEKKQELKAQRKAEKAQEEGPGIREKLRRTFSRESKDTPSQGEIK